MKEELKDFYIKKGQTMSREEMMENIFGHSQADKLNNREKELMSDDEQKIFNTAYEEGYDDGYEDGVEDGRQKDGRQKDCHTDFDNAMKFALESFANSLRYSVSFYTGTIPKAAVLEMIGYTQETLSKFF